MKKLILLLILFMSSCIDSKKLDGKLVIMDGHLYELQNRLGTGYWFEEKPLSDTLILKIYK